MNRRAAFITSAILALTPAVKAAAQDAAALPALASAYLDEVIRAARAQAASTSASGAAAVPDLLTGDPRWVAPQAQPGIGPLIGHFAIHGAEAARIDDVQLAGEAARVTATISYNELPGIDWPVTLDALWLDEGWKIREVGPARRRALPSDASPDEVLFSYLSGLEAAAKRHSGLMPRSWLAQALQSHWITGGGGYWRKGRDCPREQRADCMAAPLGGAGLWTALAQERDRRVEITDFRLHPLRPTGEVTVTTPRRTFTAVTVFDVTLEKDKRHGWQIASLERRQDRPHTAAVDLEVETTDGLALVTSLLDALTGPGAPSQAALLADPEAIARYFAESRAGRKAMAQVMNLPLMLTAMGAKADSRSVTADGPDRVVVRYDSNRGRMRRLLFSILSTHDGPMIREVLIE